MRVVRPWIRRIVMCQFVLWLLAVFAGAPQVLAAEASISSREKIEKAFAAIEAAQNRIPADTFDPVAVVKPIGPDADKLFAWVHQNTRWVPYRGVLRGPVGVLMDRNGNSLDRSLLLVEFLKTISVQTRLAHATLSADQAKKLLDQILHAEQTPLPAFDQPIPGGNGPAVMLDKIGEDVAQKSTDAAGALTPALLKPATAPDRTATMIDALADHWWVQRQDGDKWIDLDLTVPDAKPGTSVTTAAETFPCNLPDGPAIDKSLFHSVKIAVISEQWADKKFTESTLIKRTVRTSQAVGEPVYLTHVPLDWKQNPSQKDTPEDQQAALKQALTPTEWCPTLRLLVDTANESAVRPDGSVDPKPQLDALAKAGGAINKGIDGAVGVLDAGDKPDAGATPAESNSLFTAEWIEYTIHTPGQADQVLRRQVFDLIGPAARAAGVQEKPQITDAARADAALALSGSVEILLAPCQFSNAFVGHRLLQSLTLAKPSLLKALDAMQNGGGGAAEADGPPPVPAVLYGVALARHRFSPVASEVFIDKTNLLSYHSFSRFTSDAHQLRCEATDLVANDVALLPTSKADAFSARMNQGVVDTVAEQAFVPAQVRVVSAARLLATAVANSVPMTTLRAPGDVAELHLAPDVTSRISLELTAGRTVIVPSTPLHLDDEDHYAWWSIDPATGKTLGMGEQGWGAAMVEYAARIQQWIETHKRWVCLGAAAATVANIVSPLLGLNELEGDALSTIQTALDAACAG